MLLSIKTFIYLVSGSIFKKPSLLSFNVISKRNNFDYTKRLLRHSFLFVFDFCVWMNFIHILQPKKINSRLMNWIKIQRFSFKPHIKDIFKNIKQCHLSHYIFYVLKIVNFHKILKDKVYLLLYLYE